MRLLADENIPAALVAVLRGKGHDVEDSPRGANDRDIVSLAVAQERVLLTQDKDFANVLQYPPSVTKGVILLRVHPPVLEEMVRALAGVLALPAKGFSGKLFVVDRAGVRVRE
ncbi:MAG: DUF5615 family PIN-like protein [Elusimicrobia bacterium]|nr:DUF5615 family PIN-like protein [Elusimicrobiota bacterium]